MAQMFTVKDLMVNVLAQGGGAGTAGLFVETPPTPLTPITPVAAVTAFTERFEVIDKQIAANKIDVASLDQLAVDIGRAAVGARAVALCTQDMPTCRNEWISRFASDFTSVLHASDFEVIRKHVSVARKGINEARDVINERIIPELKSELGG